MEIIYSIVVSSSQAARSCSRSCSSAASATAIAIERYVTLTRVQRQQPERVDQVEPVLDEGDFDKAREMTSKDDTAMSRLIAVGLARQGAVRRRDDIEIAMEESMIGIMPQLEKRTHYLATFANLATLLGLLGTVSGLIHAFAAVATVNPAEKANLLSASISEAMNCTAFGLMIAVPIVFAALVPADEDHRADRPASRRRRQVPELLTDRQSAGADPPRARAGAQRLDGHADELTP